MPSQAFFCFKTSVIWAHAALKLSLITVDCLMSFQVLFSSKSPVTSRTREGFFSCVRSNVNFKIIFARKTLQASFALMSFIVDVLMLSQTACIFITFPANQTLVLFRHSPDVWKKYVCFKVSSLLFLLKNKINVFCLKVTFVVKIHSLARVARVLSNFF